MGVVVGRTPAHKETPQRQEGDADLAWIPTWDTREGRWLREQRLRDQPRPPQAQQAHTHLRRNAASSSSSTCLICTPRSGVMLSALTWPWEMICRGEGEAEQELTWIKMGEEEARTHTGWAWAVREPEGWAVVPG